MNQPSRDPGRTALLIAGILGFALAGAEALSFVSDREQDNRISALETQVALQPTLTETPTPMLTGSPERR